MKNRINKIVGKLFTGIVLTTALTGAAFAQSFLLEPTEKYRVRMSEQVHSQVGQNNEKWTVKKDAGVKEFRLSTVSRASFNLGSEFMLALLSAANLDAGDSAMKAAMVDLVRLIDFLEGHAEAGVLQETLKSIARKKANAAQVRLEIENALMSYSSRLTSEQK